MHDVERQIDYFALDIWMREKKGTIKCSTYDAIELFVVNFTGNLFQFNIITLGSDC